MRFWLLAAVSTLSAFAIFAVAGAMLARLAGIAASRCVERAPAVARAPLLYAIRILPLAAASLGAFAVALPTFLWFEDRGTLEPVNRTLAVAAAIGASLLARGLWRAASAWRTTAVFAGAWQRSGRRVDGLTSRLPVYAIDDAFPIVAVAGILRPRLFIAERVLREFSAPEVAAMIAHECAHISAYDNVKRLLMRACPDLPGTAAIERQWAAAAEEAADARAAALNPSVRLDLAHALIRAARLAAPSAPQLASAFYLGGSIETRVRRLITPSPDVNARRWLGLAIGAGCLACAAATVAAAPSLHAMMELAVQALP